MNLKRMTTLAVAVALALLAVGLSSGGASAHERRTVAGTFNFVVGWAVEPAIVGQPNGIDLRISDAQSNQPVEGAEKTLKADLTVGGQTKTYNISAKFNSPGAYTATLIPTKVGTWTFRFYGTVLGTPIDEKFESGPGRFGDIEPLTTYEFPAASQAQPSAAAPSSTNEAAAAASADAQRAIDRADSARKTGIAVGVAGIIVGALGIGLAIVALNQRKRDPASARPSEPI